MKNSTTLPIYQVDAFTNKVFGGNPAAVCPLEAWLPDSALQNIALENNLSETAFFVKTHDGYHIRWFTPAAEVNLCGHATMAAAHVIFSQFEKSADKILLDSLSGPLSVHKAQDGLMMDFPVWNYKKTQAPNNLIDALGAAPTVFFEGPDIVALYDSPEIIHNYKPDFEKLTKVTTPRGIIITAPGDQEYDFISRAFYPQIDVPEDPVTGSAHCILTPIWAERLNKTTLSAHQASTRGGNLKCTLENDRVLISGKTALYMAGKIYV